ncbi:MAG: GNAT family N-acetyltransferase [Verrucomicrobiota bacterium]
MELQTRRFLLRDFIASDEAAFRAYHADPRYSAFYAAEEVTAQHSQHLLELFRDWASQEPRLNFQLAVVQRQEPKALVGCVGLRRAGLPPDVAEYGMELAPDFWSRHAYAVEMGRGMLDFGFRDLGLSVVIGSTVSANARISRLTEWFGAEIVARRPGDEWMVARGFSHVDWRITRESWQDRVSRFP